MTRALLDPGDLLDLIAVPDGVPTSALLLATGAGLLVPLAVGYAVGRRRTRRTPRVDPAPAGGSAGERRAELALTVAAAGIATAVAVNGMWNVFGDALGFTGPGRLALAGFLEIALMVSAIRARRSLREHGTTGVDGAAVWALALLSAVIAAADAHGLGRAVRFAAPLVAAWLWERGLAAERRRAQARTPAVIAWRWTRERLAVRLGLAEPAQRATTDVDRARRLAALTRARLHLAVLETSSLPRPLALLTARPLRQALAVWRLQRHALAAVEHLHLGTDPTIPVTIRTTVAAVVGLRDATAPAALTTASPWTRTHPLALEPLTSTPRWSGAPAVEVPEPVPGVPVPGVPVPGVPVPGVPVPGVPVPGVPVPDAPGSGEEPIGSTVNGYVLPLPAPADSIRTDEEIVGEIVAQGVLPSTRALRKTYGIGHGRAARIRGLAVGALAHQVLITDPTTT